MGYYEFDQTFDMKVKGDPKTEDRLHHYDPHLKHFDSLGGGPTWQEDKGKRILGAINYLADLGVNSVYFLTYTIGAPDGKQVGDGGDVWPWTHWQQRDRFDCSKLDQWDRVFTHMNNKGIGILFFFSESENDRALDGGEVMGDERKLYYREMIARFGHHLNCQWMVSEEMEHTPIADAKQWITRVHQLDPYNHPIGFHSRGTSITYTTRCSMIPILTMCARITTGPPLKMCMRKLKTWSRSPSTQTILGSFAVTSRDVAPT